MAESRFTAPNREALLVRFAAGTSLRDACRDIGVREKTVKGWITRGRAETGTEYAAFVAAVDEARETAKAAPGPMTAEEFREHVERAVRAGSVAAMKLWADKWLTSGKPEPKPSTIAQLADRRRAGA